ncbi:pentatricopeptide (PPR) repeat-containing protein isoform X2 [Tasmannia lanceolata]|uniref:pentatricopeptide (PPR) repeat-containing protein isoform X2 n=1 Tax=Tasmannia lanceolata TaxID=3420 RepID=UPI0040639EC0
MELVMSNWQMGAFSLEKNGFPISNSFPNHYSVSGFSICQRPIFCIALNGKKVKHIGSFNVRTSNCRVLNALPKKDFDKQLNDGGLLEKEFKFEPVFDEYVKAMESVRTGRDKISITDVEGNQTKNSSIVKDVVGNGEDVYLGRSKWNQSKVKSIDYVERDEGEKNDKFGDLDGMTNQADELSSKKDNRGASQDSGRHKLNDKFGDSDGITHRADELSSKKDNRGTSQDSGRRKLGHIGRDRDLKGGSGLKVYKKYIDIKSNKSNLDLGEGFSDKDSMRSSQISSSGKLGYGQSEKDLQDDKGLGPCRKLHGISGNGIGERRKLIHNENYSEMQKRQMQPNGKWINDRRNNVKMIIDESVVHKSALEMEKPYGVNIERKIGDSETNGSVAGEAFVNNDTVRKSFHGRDVYRKTAESENNNRIFKRDRVYSSRVESKISKSEIGKHVLESKSLKSCDDGTNFFEQTSRQKYVRLQKDAFGAQKLGPRSTDMRDRLGRKGAGYKLSTKNETSTRPNQLFTDDTDDGGMEMERKAFKSFEVFTDVRNRPRVLRMEMEERIKKLAKGLNGTDLNIPEWQFSKMMHSAGIKFTDHTVLRVVQILGSLGNWRRALQVVQWLHLRERFKSYKSKYIYTAVLDVLGKAKRPVEALNIFHAMRQELSSYPDLAAYHCIAVTLGQAGYMKELFDVIDCMRAVPEKKFKMGMLEKWDPRLEPDVVIYNAVLNACVRRKQWEGAFWVLQQLKQQQIRPSSTTYGLIMEVMLACGKYNLVHEFFRKVEKTSIPNTLNYKVLVNTLHREGKTDEAVSAVQDMERRGIVGSASLYYDLARCLCSAGRCQESVHQIDKICKVATKPLVVTYTGLIQACLESGSIENGAYIFNQMQKFCSPNTITCNIMLKAYGEHGMFEEAMDLFQKILDGDHYIGSETNYNERVIPDRFSFNTMLEACVAEKKWDDFENVYQAMLDHGYHFNAKRHLWMIMEASRAGKAQSLDITWDYLVRSGRVVPPAIIKERFCMKLQEDKLAAAISCICSDQKSALYSFSKKAWLDLFNSNANRFQKDTLVRLVHEVSTIIAETDEPNPIFQNLQSSCKEFINTRVLETTIAHQKLERTLS